MRVLTRVKQIDCTEFTNKVKLFCENYKSERKYKKYVDTAYLCCYNRHITKNTGALLRVTAPEAARAR